MHLAASIQPDSLEEPFVFVNTPFMIMHRLCTSCLAACFAHDFSRICSFCTHVLVDILQDTVCPSICSCFDFLHSNLCVRGCGRGRVLHVCMHACMYLYACVQSLPEIWVIFYFMFSGANAWAGMYVWPKNLVVSYRWVPKFSPYGSVCCACTEVTTEHNTFYNGSKT